ncbi:unnamed protein product, partial [Iphiclides podalirius]
MMNGRPSSGKRIDGSLGRAVGAAVTSSHPRPQRQHRPVETAASIRSRAMIAQNGTNCYPINNKNTYSHVVIVIAPTCVVITSVSKLCLGFPTR